MIRRVLLKSVRAACAGVAYVTSALLPWRQVSAALVDVTGTLLTRVIVVRAVTSFDVNNINL